MGFQSEFAEILREKMGEDSIKPEPTHFNAPQPHTFFQDYISHFMPPKKWTSNAVTTKYVYNQIKSKHKDKTPLSSAETTPHAPQKVTPPQETPFALNTLCQEKQTALLEFISLGATLDKGKLTNIDIKKEYRKLVKIYHPDHNKKINTAEKLQRVILLHSIIKKTQAKK